MLKSRLLTETDDLQTEADNATLEADRLAGEAENAELRQIDQVSEDHHLLLKPSC
jgi:hypothetical protein